MFKYDTEKKDYNDIRYLFASESIVCGYLALCDSLINQSANS